ncbi:hypothetical protein MNEG_8678 [Monoraphidium neglectum]|uniref:USP domain-containing protein n=1 Tax=Monoraphidium neglectum TaxID=145388 RepID=A0A0D2MYP2_9CHLO|nr:hypothetical protein MNEG_8678 [Monoraphidium neglectum]KIY99285.1 hypothetical protein MNEG_8678 [Monoraphidium neglectum]|eukprot:XP_013898305.1 hypothetical protein MNEG_8678 [Monoraphidium neglectum]
MAKKGKGAKGSGAGPAPTAPRPSAGVAAKAEAERQERARAKEREREQQQGQVAAKGAVGTVALQQQQQAPVAFKAPHGGCGNPSGANRCYLNAALQAFFACPPLVKLLLLAQAVVAAPAAVAGTAEAALGAVLRQLLAAYKTVSRGGTADTGPLILALKGMDAAIPNMTFDDFTPGRMGDPNSAFFALVFVLRHTLGEARVGAVLRIFGRGDAECDGCRRRAPCEGPSYRGVFVDLSEFGSLVEALRKCGVPVPFVCPLKGAGCECRVCWEDTPAAFAAAEAGECRHRSLPVVPIAMTSRVVILRLQGGPSDNTIGRQEQQHLLSNAIMPCEFNAVAALPGRHGGPMVYRLRAVILAKGAHFLAASATGQLSADAGDRAAAWVASDDERVLPCGDGSLSGMKQWAAAPGSGGPLLRPVQLLYEAVEGEAPPGAPTAPAAPRAPCCGPVRVSVAPAARAAVAAADVSSSSAAAAVDADMEEAVRRSAEEAEAAAAKDRESVLGASLAANVTLQHQLAAAAQENDRATAHAAALQQQLTAVQASADQARALHQQQLAEARAVARQAAAQAQASACSEQSLRFEVNSLQERVAQEQQQRQAEGVSTSASLLRAEQEASRNKQAAQASTKAAAKAETRAQRAEGRAASAEARASASQQQLAVAVKETAQAAAQVAALQQQLSSAEATSDEARALHQQQLVEAQAQAQASARSEQSLRCEVSSLQERVAQEQQQRQAEGAAARAALLRTEQETSQSKQEAQASADAAVKADKRAQSADGRAALAEARAAASDAAARGLEARLSEQRAAREASEERAAAAEAAAAAAALELASAAADRLHLEEALAARGASEAEAQREGCPVSGQGAGGRERGCGAARAHGAPGGRAAH